MGSSGGGSGAGAVDYPDYMKLTHADWLTQGDLVAIGTAIDKSIAEVMNQALDQSPWLDAEEPDVSGRILAYESAIGLFAGILGEINIGNAMSSFYLLAVDGIGSYEPIEVENAGGDIGVSDIVVDDAEGLDDTAIILDTAAFANQLDDEILTKVLPRFRRGMQDINAVVSSAYVLGAANIEGFRDRDVARHSSTLRVNAALKNVDVNIANMGKDVEVGKANQLKDSTVETANMKKNIQVGEINTRNLADYKKMYLEGTKLLLHAAIQTVMWHQDYARLVIEGQRIAIVAEKEHADLVNSNDEEDALWNLEVFQYGANVLAAISGGVAGGAKRKKPSALSSALGGALSGAASGAMVGAQIGSGYAGYGAIIGAVLGAAIGLLSSQ